ENEQAKAGEVFAMTTESADSPLPPSSRPARALRRVRISTPRQARQIVEALVNDLCLADQQTYQMAATKLKAMAQATQVLMTIWEKEDLLLKYQQLKKKVEQIRVAPTGPTFPPRMH